jgi:hypothetical protein
MSDFTLPKFNDYVKQNIVNFLEDLDIYFQLKIVPAEMKLPTAMKPLTEITHSNGLPPCIGN